jgi:hemerythrin-like metal-binding protein
MHNHSALAEELMNPELDPNDIDAEHHIQLGLTQALCDAVSRGADEALTRKILDQLVAYSDMHFLSEQLLMRLSGYPDYGSHALEHDHLMERLETVKQQYGSAGEQTFTLPEAQAILEFLAGHISTQDRRFTDYYRDWARRNAAAG